MQIHCKGLHRNAGCGINYNLLKGVQYKPPENARLHPPWDNSLKASQVVRSVFGLGSEKCLENYTVSSALHYLDFCF